MRNKYDLLVIGGGPGGAIAARTAAESGLSTCLVEKRPAIGSPVRCAEGIGRDVLHEFIDPDPQWISAEISQAEIVAPDGTRMILDPTMAGSKIGYVLERKVFDRVLISQAADAGADIRVKTGAKAPEICHGKVCGAVLEDGSAIHADIIIAADGVESRFSRQCGIDTTVPPQEMMVCAQYLMTGIDIDPTSNIFHVGNEIAPQGYLWIFPKGRRSANVGVGIQGIKSGNGHRAKDYLDSFVRNTFPDGKMIEFVAGGVPVCRPLSSTVADGLMIVGDAARVVEPFTGGGIYNAMFTGKLAGEVASECISGDCSRAALVSYDDRWRSSPLGQNLQRNYALKEYFITVSDGDFNQLIRSASEIQLEEFGVVPFMKELLVRNPGLLPGLIRHGIRL